MKNVGNVRSLAMTVSSGSLAMASYGRSLAMTGHGGSLEMATRRRSSAAADQGLSGLSAGLDGPF